MELVKKIIKPFLKNNKILTFATLIFKYLRGTKSIVKTCVFALKYIFRNYTPSPKSNKGKQISSLLNKQNIIINSDGFIYFLDPYKNLYYTNKVIENITIDYNRVMNISLLDFKDSIIKLENSEYKDNQMDLIDGLISYVDKIIDKLKQSKREDKEKIIEYFQNIKDGKVNSFEEALQRILFYNQILWQTGHLLNGLGRLDKILGDIYLNDIKNNVISKDDAKRLLLNFCKVLHENYWYKSSSLMGDTGQIIILGGKEIDGSYFSNELTYLFIEVMKEMQLPDPKVLLRVSERTPRDLIELSIDCIKTGIGCPLFSNDDVVIDRLIEFGYEKDDAYNYVTSACWEPLIASKSIDPNNIKSIIYLKPFNDMLKNEKLDEIKSKNDLVEKYKEYLRVYINDRIEEANEVRWENDPLLSLFTEDCDGQLKDISDGGAMYNNYGLTSVSLSNTINAIEVINELVFEEKKYSLKELEENRKNNFSDDNIYREIKNIKKAYGIDEEQSISLVDDITKCVKDTLKEKKNIYGGAFKFGLSAPSYISDSQNFEASLDGRKYGEAFGVHISSDNGSDAYTGLIRFASQLDYTDGRFNGNVIDFMVTPNFIDKNYEKFVDFISLSIKSGFFQMQMNVISSDILIEAKKDPKKFPNLIVRVWGFSAYFNDLPENYKNLLIERALKSEGKNY